MLQLHAHLHAALSGNENIWATVLCLISLFHYARPESMRPVLSLQNTVPVLVPPSPPPQHRRRASALCSASFKLLAGSQSMAGGAVRAPLSTSRLSTCSTESGRHFGITKYYINRRGLCAHCMSLFVFPKIYWCDSWLAFSVLLMGK